jgi:hypothetical protein
MCARPGTLGAESSLCFRNKESLTMLYTLAVVLVVLWLLGLVSSYTLGGFIHILLVVGIVLLLVRLVGGRRSLNA